jgi:N4-gp56 family major capsid protein
MPATDFAALSDANKRLWMAEIIAAGRDESFWESNGMIATSMNSPVQLINEMTETERGAECVMQLVSDMTSDGVVGDNLMEGNEDVLYNDAQVIRLDQIRNALRHKGRMSEQKTVLRFRTLSREKLGFWLAEKTDELMFLTLAGMTYDKKLDNSTRAGSQLPSLAFNADVTAPTSGRRKFAGTATSTGTLTINDKLTWNKVIELQSYAKRKKMRPIRGGGRDHCILLVGPEGMRDLKSDSTYQTNVGRAGVRGPDNPMFKNAVANIDGVLIYEHNKVPNTHGLISGTNKWGSGNTVEGSQAFFIGAQALGFSKIGGAQYNESDNKDYNNRPALAIGRMMGMLKPQFVSLTDVTAGVPTKQDFGVISFYHAAAQ